MAISLKNHDDRIKVLESKSNESVLLGKTMSSNLANNSRKFGVEYTNSSTKYIIVYVSGSGNNATFPFLLNGVTVTWFNGYHRETGGCVIIPPGFKYQFNSSGATLHNWFELT